MEKARYVLFYVDYLTNITYNIRLPCECKKVRDKE